MSPKSNVFCHPHHHHHHTGHRILCVPWSTANACLSQDQVCTCHLLWLIASGLQPYYSSVFKNSITVTHCTAQPLQNSIALWSLGGKLKLQYLSHHNLTFCPPIMYQLEWKQDNFPRPPHPKVFWVHSYWQKHQFRSTFWLYKQTIRGLGGLCDNEAVFGPWEEVHCGSKSVL